MNRHEIGGEAYEKVRFCRRDASAARGYVERCYFSAAKPCRQNMHGLMAYGINIHGLQKNYVKDRIRKKTHRKQEQVKVDDVYVLEGQKECPRRRYNDRNKKNGKGCFNSFYQHR